MSAWRPGDVARVQYGAVDQIALVRPRRSANGELEFAYVSGGYDMVSDVEPHALPIVVIDPDDAEQVERLLRLWVNTDPDDAAWAALVDNLTTALHEYANPTPRIEEPIGLGAVVEDERGRRFVRQWTIPDPDGQAWRQENGHGLIAWCDFDPVRVLSHGVTPEEAS